MKKTSNLIKSAALAVALASLAAPAWAWRGGGWGGGWRGPRIGVVVGVGAVGFGPWWGYPYDPYYYGWYPDPYSYGPNVAAYPETAPDNAQYDISIVENRIARMRADAEHAYEDGDISQEQRDSRLEALGRIDQEAKEMASANGGFLTGEEVNVLARQLRGEPVVARAPKPKPAAEPAAAAPAQLPGAAPAATASRADLASVNSLQRELHALLDRKLKDGDITKAQHDGEIQYLDDIHEQERAQAAANGGAPSADQLSSQMSQLQREYYRINHNFIGQ